MSIPSASCPKCARRIDANWEFCPFCGQALESPAVGQVRRKLIAPPALPLDHVSGPCVVVSFQRLPEHTSALGKMVAEALGRPLVEVTAAMSLARGIVARGVDVAAARRLHKVAQSEGLSLAAIPEKEWVSFRDLVIR